MCVWASWHARTCAWAWSYNDFDADKVKYVLEHEPVVDALERDITDYLTQMSSSEMSESLTTRHTGLLHACTDIERIGDHGETLAKRARKLVEDDVVFSDEAKAELLQLSEWYCVPPDVHWKHWRKMIRLLRRMLCVCAVRLSISEGNPQESHHAP